MRYYFFSTCDFKTIAFLEGPACGVPLERRLPTGQPRFRRIVGTAMQETC